MENVDFNKVIKRTDYKRLSSKLVDKAEGIARAIRNKMLQLGYLYASCNDGFGVYVDTVYTNLGKVHCLKIDGSGSLEYIDKDFYAYGDYDAHVTGCTRQEALVFLNHAREILQVLSDVETEQVNAIEEALKGVEGL